jgi:hypothetical protein
MRSQEITDGVDLRDENGEKACKSKTSAIKGISQGRNSTESELDIEEFHFIENPGFSEKKIPKDYSRALEIGAKQFRSVPFFMYALDRCKWESSFTSSTFVELTNRFPRSF